MGKNKIKILNFILYIWQLPQNLLGILVKIFTKAESIEHIHYWKYNSGLSLGKYIFVNKNAPFNTIFHEEGHQKQSLYLGWLYLIIIGLPSIIWATLKTLGLFSNVSYYWFYTEAWADKLSNIKRNK